MFRIKVDFSKFSLILFYSWHIYENKKQNKKVVVTRDILRSKVSHIECYQQGIFLVSDYGEEDLFMPETKLGNISINYWSDVMKQYLCCKN